MNDGILVIMLAMAFYALVMVMSRPHRPKRKRSSGQRVNYKSSDAGWIDNTIEPYRTIITSVGRRPEDNDPNDRAMAEWMLDNDDV